MSSLPLHLLSDNARVEADGSLSVGGCRVDEIAAKFRSNAELTFASERVDQVLDAIMDLDGKSTPAQVAELLSPA